MLYIVYILAGLAGGVLTGMAGLTAAMVLTPILCSVCGWSGYDAVTLSLIANVPSAMVTCWTFYKNGNIQMKKGMPMAVVAFAGAVVGSYLGYLFSIPKSGKLTEVTDYVPTILLFGAIGLLIVASFLPFEMPAETNGLICCGLLVIGLIYNYAKNKNMEAIMGPLKAIDLETLGLLTGLFLMIGGISEQGVIDALAQLLAKLGAGNPFLMYTMQKIILRTFRKTKIGNS